MEHSKDSNLGRDIGEVGVMEHSSSPPRCAHCEVSPATLECEDEDLLYCTPCSASLHAKRGRTHHVLRPLRLCDQCEAAAALLSCVLCGGRGDPLTFCLNCSSDLHSRKARAHHKLDTIPTTHLQRPSKGLPNHGGRKPFIESYSNTSGTRELLQDSISRKHPRRDEEPFGAANKENHGPVASRNPKRILPQKHSSDGSSSSSDEDTSEDDETYGTKKYRKGSVTLEAFVVDVHDHEEGQTSRGAFPEHYQDEAEGGVQARIRKMLELGLHPDTPDNEAQQALKNAQRLLTKHNLQQADVLKGGLQANKHAFKGGMRMVELRSKDKNQPGRFEHWVYSLALTVAKYFDTQYFVQRRSVLQVVFYGIKQNVDCAGYAFAATFNRITKLSADYIPSKLLDAGKSNKGCKLKVGSSQSVYSRVSRMSYRNGLVEGLFETVKTSKLQQQKSSTNCRGREKNEKVNSKGATSAGNIADTRYSDWGSSDDECLSPDDFDGLDGADECVSRHKNHRSSQDWETDRSAAVSALIVHSKKVGDDFLKEKKIKVTTRKQESPTIWDGEAFLKGKRDSKTIDLGQRGITAKARKTAAL